MKVNVREWLAMNIEHRVHSIAFAVYQNNEGKKEHKKSLQALACK